MDEERLKRMIHLAMYEQVDGREDIEISRFFRSDYIGLGLLKNIVLMTIAYFIVLGFAAIYNFEYLAVNFSRMNVSATIVILVVSYVIFTGIFSAIIFVVRGLRYERAARRINKYNEKLYELEDYYKLEKLIKRREKGTGTRRDNR